MSGRSNLLTLSQDQKDWRNQREEDTTEDMAREEREIFVFPLTLLIMDVLLLFFCCALLNFQSLEVRPY